MLLTKQLKAEPFFKRDPCKSTCSIKEDGEVNKCEDPKITEKTKIQDEEGHLIKDNKIVENYFVVIPKDSRWTRMRKIITHELTQDQLFRPGEKETPKYPIFGTQPKVNEELYLVKDPNNKIYLPRMALFPCSRAEYQWPRLTTEDRQTLPIGEHVKQGTAEVTAKRYGKNHHNLEYFNRNPIDQPRTIYKPEYKRRNFQDRNDAITKKCLELEDFENGKDVRGLWPSYASLFHKTCPLTGGLKDQGFHHEPWDYARIKTPYDYRNLKWSVHPWAEETPLGDKEQVRKDLFVAYARMAEKHGKHDFDKPPESVGETEWMRRERGQRDPKLEYPKPELPVYPVDPEATKFTRPQLIRFQPDRVNANPLRAKGAPSERSMCWPTTEDPIYHPRVTNGEYYHELYHDYIRKGFVDKLESRRREQEHKYNPIKEKIKGHECTLRDYHSPVEAPPPHRVMAITEKQKNMAKHEDREQKSQLRADDRVCRPQRPFSVKMKI